MVEHQQAMSGTKVCKTCKVEKHVLCFAQAKANKDGLHGSCRECINTKQRRRYRDKHPIHTLPSSFDF